MSTNQKIITIVGPTSSGKSDLAVDIALKINFNKKRLGVNGAEIISADSRQIYKGFDLSSGKITKKEMRGVPHYMLDIVSPRKTFTVAQFKKRAEKTINKLHKQNKIPILCGGTGFWIDSVIYDFSIPNVPPNSKLRKRLMKLDDKKLFEMLLKIDPDRAENIDNKNKLRLIRAIEIAKSIGKVPKLKKTKKYNSLIIGINPGKEVLGDRIYKRLIKRIENGMIEEIKTIRDGSISYKRLECFGLEFRWISRYLQGKINKKEMMNGLYSDIKKYAKRQMTWFKRNKEIIWIKKPQLDSKLWNQVADFIQS